MTLLQQEQLICQLQVRSFYFSSLTLLYLHQPSVRPFCQFICINSNFNCVFTCFDVAMTRKLLQLGDLINLKFNWHSSSSPLSPVQLFSSRVAVCRKLSIDSSSIPIIVLFSQLKGRAECIYFVKQWRLCQNAPWMTGPFLVFLAPVDA